MRNLLALVGLATVTFVGLGWYLGWYKLEKTTSPGSTIQIGIDTKKVTQDVHRGVTKVGELIDSLGSSDNSSRSWYEAPAPKAPPAVTQSNSWYEAPVPPATAKPASGWRVIPTKR
jgi:hypothetical protein